MAFESNLKDLGVLLQAMKGDHLSRQEFTDAFKSLVDVIKSVRDDLVAKTTENNSASLKEAEAKITKALETLSKAETSLNAKFEQHVKDMQSDARTTLRMIEMRLDEMADMIPDGYDDLELRDMVENVRAQIPEMPEAFDPTEIMQEIEKLEKDMEELKKRPVGSGGGVTNARIQQAFKYILKTEEPVGDIDGVNLTYTLSQPIFAILSMSLNGETIAQLPNYTISGNTFTFSTALPAAYSGKDWEVKYI